MAEIITMPRLSDTMTEGVVAQWLKKVGDKISEGDILAEIETDKATMEFESFNEGTLLYIGLKDGESAPVDSLLAIIGDDGENIDSIIKDFKVATPVQEKSQANEEISKAPAPVKEAGPDLATTTQPAAVQQPFVNKDKDVYGMFYMINGNAATQAEFYATDSLQHFVNGALYFDAKPNFDSIYPAVMYLRNDMRIIMETLAWKNEE